MRSQTGPTKWNQTMHLDGEAEKEIFTLLKNTCKLIQRIVVTIRNQNG